MALSRIWSLFIITAILVALGKFLFTTEREDIFSKMVTGTNSESVNYVAIGNSTYPTVLSIDSFVKQSEKYAYNKKDKVADADYIITDTPAADTVQQLLKQKPALQVISYNRALNRLQKPVDGVFATAKSAVEICLGLIGIMALFMGFMQIAEVAGGVRLLSKIIGPFFTKIFPDVPKGHPAIGHMMMNFSANLLGLDNAATPFGIKAMQSLQEINPDPTKASNAQIMFLCLHASGLTLIPVAIIAARSTLKVPAINPTDIFLPCMIATFVATMAAMTIVSYKQKINLLQPVILAWVGGTSAVIALLVIYIKSLNAQGVNLFSGMLSNGIILFIFIAIVLGGLYKKIDLFDAFVQGAKNGFDTAVKIIPYLVGMLVAISLLRSSGTFDSIIYVIKTLFAAVGADTRFVDGIPTALVKPMSGGAARGMMIDTMKTYGADSFAGRLACILQGSSDTTFYIIAVYFGVIGVKNTRYAIGTMLLADLVGIITSILLAYLFFGNVT